LTTNYGKKTVKRKGKKKQNMGLDHENKSKKRTKLKAVPYVGDS
jgi:hypothetical protein